MTPSPRLPDVAEKLADVTDLIALARYRDARRSWDAAREALGFPNSDAEPHLYEELHVWVARLLIHRGQTEFAEAVLADVPDEMLEAHAGLRAMHRRLTVLIEAQTRGAFAPAVRLEQPEWWKRGPFLLPGKLREGPPRIEWIAARVDEVGAKELHLGGLRIVSGDDPPEPCTLSIEFARFDALSADERARDLSAERFLEIGKYAQPPKGSRGGQKPAVVHIRVHPVDAWDARELPPLFPDPARYART